MRAEEKSNVSLGIIKLTPSVSSLPGSLNVHVLQSSRHCTGICGPSKRKYVRTFQPEMRTFHWMTRYADDFQGHRNLRIYYADRRSEVCTTISAGSPNPYFAPNIYIPPCVCVGVCVCVCVGVCVCVCACVCVCVCKCVYVCMHVFTIHVCANVHVCTCLYVCVCVCVCVCISPSMRPDNMLIIVLASVL